MLDGREGWNISKYISVQMTVLKTNVTKSAGYASYQIISTQYKVISEFVLYTISSDALFVFIISYSKIILEKKI